MAVTSPPLPFPCVGRAPGHSCSGPTAVLRLLWAGTDSCAMPQLDPRVAGLFLPAATNEEPNLLPYSPAFGTYLIIGL